MIDVAKNKVFVEEQFKRFVEEETKQVKSKKVKLINPLAVETIDLASTPLPPSPTQIIQEDMLVFTNISLTNLCKSAMSETLKEKVDKDVDLQQFINKLPNLFLKAQQITTTHKIVDSSYAQQSLTIQTI